MKCFLIYIYRYVKFHVENNPENNYFTFISINCYRKEHKRKELRKKKDLLPFWILIKSILVFNSSEVGVGLFANQRNLAFNHLQSIMLVYLDVFHSNYPIFLGLSWFQHGSIYNFVRNFSNIPSYIPESQH